jgi:hypothetical protein
MSFWQRLRDSFRGPPRIHDSEDDPAEIADDLDDEMPDAAEDAREMAERPGKVAEEMEPVGGWTDSPLAPQPPDTIELESDKAASSENADASDHAS